MKFLILRKKRIFQKKKIEKIILNDIEIEIVYIFRVNKKIRWHIREFDCVLSVDFKEFFQKIDLLKAFAWEGYEKILSRHGGINKDVLEVRVDILNEENIKILTDFALKKRRVIVHSQINPEEFDFLCAEAGVCPEFAKSDYKESVVVHFGEEFFIEHLPTGMIYYDILPALPVEFNAYFLPEANMIFSEYIRQNPKERSNVKIRELMSK